MPVLLVLLDEFMPPVPIPAAPMPGVWAPAIGVVVIPEAPTPVPRVPAVPLDMPVPEFMPAEPLFI
jgi:hypothetical protein